MFLKIFEGLKLKLNLKIFDNFLKKNNFSKIFLEKSRKLRENDTDDINGGNNEIRGDNSEMRFTFEV